MHEAQQAQSHPIQDDHAAAPIVHCAFRIVELNDGPIAQSVEQMAFNHWVPGSSPGRITKIEGSLSGCLCYFLVAGDLGFGVAPTM